MKISLVLLTCCLQFNFVFMLGCSKINNYENGLPVGLKNISNYDQVGPLLIIVHQIYALVARNVPVTPDMCKTRIISFGKYDIKLSFRPRGCCSHCCLVDRVEDYVHLYYANKEFENNPIKLNTDRKRGRLKAMDFNNKAKTIIFIPGFTEHGMGVNSATIRNAYLNRNESYNVITVGWGDFTPMPWYVEAVDNTKLVAVVLARFIKFYHRTGELPIENLHIVGFSLGAHIGGFIGRIIRRIKILPRITALDPAFTLYSETDVNQRLTASDAAYVDVIHTDPGKFGFPISIGHADFYPNYDTSQQPGCRIGELIDKLTIELFSSCEHLRAVELYAESVKNPTSFPAVKINTMNTTNIRKARFYNDAYMGFLANKSTTFGDFYLVTNNQEPFGKSIEEQRYYLNSLRKKDVIY